MYIGVDDFVEVCMARDKDQDSSLNQEDYRSRPARERVPQLITDLKKYGLIPDNVDKELSRGAQPHKEFLRQMGRAADAKGGMIIDLLEKALKEEISQNGKALIEIKDANPKETPCAGKIGLIMDAMKQLEKEYNEEKKQRENISLKDVAGFVARDAAGLTAKVARNWLPEWASKPVVGPAPPKAEPPKVKTIIELAAAGGNKEALKFQETLKAHKEVAEIKQQTPPPSPSGSRAAG